MRTRGRTNNCNERRSGFFRLINAMAMKCWGLHDKRAPIDVAKQFEFVLSYSTALPARLPQFYNYLLRYPNGKPTNVEDMFYWARVKFGLKPTLRIRIVQVTTMLGKPGDDLACAIAEKQLYSIHYFEAALELSFCVRGQEDLRATGLLPDHGNVIGTGGSNRHEGIDCPQSSSEPIRFESSACAHIYSRYAGSQQLRPSRGLQPFHDAPADNRTSSKTSKASGLTMVAQRSAPSCQSCEMVQKSASRRQGTDAFSARSDLLEPRFLWRKRVGR